MQCQVAAKTLQMKAQNCTPVQKLKFNHVTGIEREGGTESHPQTVSQYFNMAFKTVIAIRIGTSSENVWVFCMRSAVLTEQALLCTGILMICVDTLLGRWVITDFNQNSI